jgi:L-asparagine oxygenase
MSTCTTTPPVSYTLGLADVSRIESLLDELSQTGDDPGGERFYERGWELVARLPDGLRRFLHEFRSAETSAAALLHGLPVDDAQLGPTPPGWRQAADSGAGRREEYFLALVGMALGEPYTWSTLQDGRMIQNVLPVQGEESEQSGHGQVLLEWHTEDGFHPDRCDYLLLFGTRNHDGTPTTFASVQDVRLSDEHRAVLSQERFHILPDDEHLRQLAAKDPRHPGLAQMRKMRESPKPVAVLFGAEDDPYLRIDPYFMRCLPGDNEAEVALKEIVRQLEEAQQDITVGQGSLLIVDNYRAVHGRKAFKARFDGTDRWLKKLIVARDLRPSRGSRESASSRVLS